MSSHEFGYDEHFRAKVSAAVKRRGLRLRFRSPNVTNAAEFQRRAMLPWVVYKPSDRSNSLAYGTVIQEYPSLDMVAAEYQVPTYDKQVAAELRVFGRMFDTVLHDRGTREMVKDQLCQWLALIEEADRG